jgi:hypothetical protein
VPADKDADSILTKLVKEVFTGENAPDTGPESAGPNAEGQETPTAPSAAEAPTTEQRLAQVEGLLKSLAAQEPQPPVLTEQPKEAPSPSEVKEERQSRTATEMAGIILEALRKIADAPERGFIVTVYGSNPWNAMLTITPEAGRVKDVQLWRTRVQDIGARLRQDFDVLQDNPG